MKKSTLFLLFLVCNLTAVLGQVKYVAGSITKVSGETISCEIKDVGWENAPRSVWYMTDGEQTNISVDSLTSFELDGVARYICSMVPLDVSSDLPADFNLDRDPDFKNKRLCLRIIYRGAASLYQYKKRNIERYFYQIGTSGIKPLVSKKYKNSNDQILENNDFRQELWMNLQCSTLVITDMENLYYKAKPLIKVFKKYNTCKGGVEEVIKVKNSREVYNLNIRPRLDMNSYSMANYLGRSDISFPDYLSFVVGFENEFYFPFLNNKLSFITEPTFQYYKGETDIIRTGSYESTTLVATYQSFNIPFGIRYYTYLGEANKSRLYADVSHVLAIAVGGGFDAVYTNPLKFSNSSTMAFGLGYSYNNRVDFQVRYLPARGVLDGLYTGFETMSVIVGYRLFRLKN